VRAIAAIAGGGPFGACDGDPISALIIHGTVDLIVPFVQGEGSRDIWTAAAGCDATTTPIDPDPCVAYDGCDPGLAVRWCAHDEAANSGHGWPSFAAGAAWQLFEDSP
jgi:polyhydroxybutyrate depolymerase